MNKIITLTLVAVIGLAPIAASASLVQEELPETDTTSMLEEWVEDYETTEIDISAEDFSLDALNRRIALELIDLREQVANLYELRERAGWLASLRTAWEEHKIAVQVRRIMLLVKTGERRDAISETIAEELQMYLQLITTEVRD